MASRNNYEHYPHKLTVRLTAEQYFFVRRLGSGRAATGVRRLVDDMQRRDAMWGGLLYSDQPLEEDLAE